MKHRQLEIIALLYTIALCATISAGTVVIASANATSATPTELTNSIASTDTAIRDELTRQIGVRTKELDDLGNKLSATRAELNGIREEKSSLQRELNLIKGSINELNLSIKADEISIQKLGLEAESLRYDIEDVKSSIVDKEKAVAKILNEIQQRDRLDRNLLAVFLRNSSLAGGILEAQALSNLQSQLSIDIANLRDLHKSYNQKIAEVDEKRGSAVSHQMNLNNKKLIVQDQKAEREEILAETKNRESIYSQLLSVLEKERQEIENEIEAMGAILRTKVDPSMLPPLQSGVLAMPVENGKNHITQGYGKTIFAIANYRSQWHNGIDIGALIGTPVYAAEEGMVVAVGNQDNYCPRAAAGKFIVISHTNNLVTLYAHLSRQVVKKGDTVTRGQTIGYIGKTGWATGPHLHFTVFAGPTYYLGPSKSCGPMPYGGDLNPLSYL